MNSVKMYDLLGRQVLASRDSARTIKQQIAEALLSGDGEVPLDFEGVLGLAPAFLDETLHIVKECVAAVGYSRIRVKMIYPPSELSSKYLAVGRAHGLSVSKAADGSWVISNGGDAPAS